MTKTTQNWKIGGCLNLLPSIEDKSINMILCDLPYGTTACRWDTIIPFEPLWKEWMRIIVDNGAVVLTASQPFTTKLINSNMDMFKYEWVWVKNRGSNFAQTKTRPMKEHENILIFYKSQPTYNRQMQERAASGKSRVKYDVNPSTTSENYNNIKQIKKPHKTIPTLRVPSSVQKFNTEVGLHPTQKPVPLFEYLIKTYTNEGDWVHDSCLGSGTTLEACRNTNRNCIGFEISDEWEKHYEGRAMKSIPSLDSFR